MIVWVTRIKFKHCWKMKFIFWFCIILSSVCIIKAINGQQRRKDVSILLQYLLTRFSVDEIITVKRNYCLEINIKEIFFEINFCICLILTFEIITLFLFNEKFHSFPSKERAPCMLDFKTVLLTLTHSFGHFRNSNMFSFP